MKKMKERQVGEFTDKTYRFEHALSVQDFFAVLEQAGFRTDEVFVDDGKAAVPRDAEQWRGTFAKQDVLRELDVILACFSDGLFLTLPQYDVAGTTITFWPKLSKVECSSRDETFELPERLNFGGVD